MGTHIVIYTKDPEADRAFIRDVLQFPSVDAGDRWLPGVGDVGVYQPKHPTAVVGVPH